MDSMSKESNRTLKEQFMLRMPDGMRDRIKAAADANNRSMTQEIVATLEEAYPEPDPHDLAVQMVVLMDRLFKIRSETGATRDEALRIKRALDNLTSLNFENGSPEDKGFDAGTEPNVRAHYKKHSLAQIELLEALVGSEIKELEELKTKLKKSTSEG